MSNQVSPQSQDEALAVAKSTQKPGQTKAQTKLIAAGIEKGIAEYKKQHKAKLREQDKQRKKEKRNKAKVLNEEVDVADESREQTSPTQWLPWVLLTVSWVVFIGIWFTKNS